jgi:hypothetical protein
MIFFLTPHFWEFFFGESGKHFYEANVYGNVIAVLPLGVLAIGGWLWHRGAVEETHRKLDLLAEKHDAHAEHLKKILDALDPESEGGIKVLHDHIMNVEDLLDPQTPKGLKVILEALETKNSTMEKK